MPRKAANPTTTAGLNLKGLSDPTVYHGSDLPVSPEVQDWVEESYEYWLDHQTKWRTVTLESEKAVQAVVAEARRYVNQVRDEPLTFQIKSAGTKGATLTYRVRESLKRS